MTLLLSIVSPPATGTFAAAQNFTTGTNPNSAVMADLNGDGKFDLVAVNFNGNSVSILLGNGNGTFQAAQNFATGSGPRQWRWGTSTATASSTWSWPTKTTTM